MRWAGLLAAITGCSFEATLPTAPIDAPDPESPPIDTPDAPGTFWTAVVGANASDNDLMKTAVNGWNNAGAISQNQIGTGNGYLEFTTAETNCGKALGLSNGNADNNFTDIDFAFLLTQSGLIEIYESGVRLGTNYGPYTSTDTFRIEVTPTSVTYLRNGAVLLTNPAAIPTFPLIADAALFTSGGTLTSVVIVDQ